MKWQYKLRLRLKELVKVQTVIRNMRVTSTGDCECCNVLPSLPAVCVTTAEFKTGVQVSLQAQFPASVSLPSQRPTLYDGDGEKYPERLHLACSAVH